jgi:hypothetical protein
MAKSNFSFDDVKNIFNINQSRNSSFLEYYKNYLMYVMDRQIELDKDEETKWMANIKSPTTFFISSTLYGMYLTAQTQFDLTKRVTDENSELIGEKLIAMNQYYYDNDDTSENIDRVALDAMILGTGFGQAIYKTVSDELNYMKKWGKKNVKKTYKIPSAEYISPLNIFIDPAAKTIYNSRFVIIRKIKNKSSLNDYYKDLMGWTTIDITKLDAWEIIENKDRDMVIKYMMFNNMPWVTGAWYRSNTSGVVNTSQHYDILTDNSFEFGEKKDWKLQWDLCEIFEVHTDDDITIFVNGKKYGAYQKTFAWRKKPFFSMKLKSGLNMLYGLGSGHLAYNLQKMSDMFLNLRMDTSRLEATAPIAVDAGDSFFDGKSVFKPFPWKIVKLTDVNKGWKKMEYGYNPAIAGAEVEAITKMIQDSLGLSGYSMGIQQKVERVARWVQELIESVDRSFADFVKSYGRAMSFLQKYWTVMTISTVDGEFIQRVLWDDMIEIKDIPLEDVVYEYKFGFNLNPMKKQSDAAMVQQLIQFLQTQGESTRPDGTPLVDKEFVLDKMIELMDLPDGTKLTKDEAFTYMKDQIQRNADLKKAEQELMPPQPLPDGTTELNPWAIVPDFNTKPDSTAPQITANTPIPWIPQVNNPDGNNGWM